MRKLLILVFIFITKNTFAQFPFPSLSPEGSVHQQVGYTTIDIQYGRPEARERKIMGGIVPYKKLWRTGAGKGTSISFDADVVINNKTIKAGIYSLTTIPDKKEWTVLLNTDTSKIYGDPTEYDINSEVFRFNVIPETTSRFYESLTITLDIVHGDAVFILAWERTLISFKIATGSHQKTRTEITKSLNEKPEDLELLNSAAWYYYMNNESSEQVLAWVNKALSIKEDHWAYAQKIDVLVRMKNYTEARATTIKIIDFIKNNRYDGWEKTITEYEEKMKRWPK